MTNYAEPPTDPEIIQAFTSYLVGRADAGVLLARAVREVRFAAETVRVVIDPAHAGAEYWALMETAPYKNVAEFYGTPVAFNDDESAWVRQRVAAVEVGDVDGRTIDTISSAELNRRAAGQG